MSRPAPPDVGALRFAVRPTPGPRFLAAVVLTTALAGAVGALVPEGGALGAVGGVVGLLLVHGGLLGAGLVEQHRVHDAALVLGPTAGRARPYVLPWSQLDPGSLQVHRRANLVGSRYGAVGTSRNLRTAVYSTSAVSVVGPAPLGGSGSVRWLMGVRDPEPLARAVERAMVDAGLPAQGAAERALAAPVVEQRRR